MTDIHVHPPPSPDPRAKTIKVKQSNVTIFLQIHEAVKNYLNAFNNDTNKIGISTDCDDNPHTL